MSCEVQVGITAMPSPAEQVARGLHSEGQLVSAGGDCPVRCWERVWCSERLGCREGPCREEAVEATGVTWMPRRGAEGGREEAVGAPPYSPRPPPGPKLALHSPFIFVHVKVKL